MPDDELRDALRMERAAYNGLKDATDLPKQAISDAIVRAINDRTATRYGEAAVPEVCNRVVDAVTARDAAHVSLQEALAAQEADAKANNTVRVGLFELEAEVESSRYEGDVLTDAAVAEYALNGKSPVYGSLLLRSATVSDRADSQAKAWKRLADDADRAEGAGTNDNLPGHARRLATARMAVEEFVRMRDARPIPVRPVALAAQAVPAPKDYDSEPVKAVLDTGMTRRQLSNAKETAQEHNKSLEIGARTVDRQRAQLGLDALPPNRWQTPGTTMDKHREAAANWRDAAMLQERLAPGHAKVSHYARLATEHDDKAASIERKERIVATGTAPPSPRPRDEEPALSIFPKMGR